MAASEHYPYWKKVYFLEFSGEQSKFTGNSKMYSAPFQAPMIDLFAKIVHGLKPLRYTNAD